MAHDLAELLKSEGLLDAEELADLERVRKRSGVALEQLLLKKGLIDEPTLLKLRARIFGLDFIEKLNYKEDESFEPIPRGLIQRERVVPIEKSGRTITIALSDPGRLHHLDELRLMLRPLRVRFVVATSAEVMRLIHAHYNPTQDASEVLDDIDDEYADFSSISEESLDPANEAPIIRMVNAILAQGVQERASDIHIEPYERNMDVRFRIDGMLHRRLSPPKVIHAGVVSRIKIMANLNIAENRLPQDGRIKLKLSGKDIDIRVSTLPTRYGERVVMRLLNKSDMEYSLDSLGFRPEMAATIRKLIFEPHGIFLVTGPTGSGKTTSLYGFLSELNHESRNILTAEDPIEYEIEGIGQMQIHEKIQLTFASALRSMLRQDPDVIMVGEMRDSETARIAIQASLTGHLVFSTLHTNDAAAAVTRMIDMGIEPYLITSTVRAILAQRLLRRICKNCATAYTPTKAELGDCMLRSEDLKGGKLYRGNGCEECSGTGYHGRIGIYELLQVNEKIQRAVLRGRDAEGIKREAVEAGMETLFTAGRRLLTDGLTTSEELLRVT